IPDLVAFFLRLGDELGHRHEHVLRDPLLNGLTRGHETSPVGEVVMIASGTFQERWKEEGFWSGRWDLNPRPPEPHSGTLPGCATARLGSILTRTGFRNSGVTATPWPRG